MKPVAFALMCLAACSNADPVYDEYKVSALCAATSECGGGAPSASCGVIVPSQQGICVLLRDNGVTCPQGGSPVAWGTTVLFRDGHTTVDAHFGCVRECGDDGDCGAGTLCRGGGCYAR